MQQTTFLRLPAVRVVFTWSRVSLLVIAASTLLVALVAGSSAGAAGTVVAVVASMLASQPIRPVLAPLVAPLARGAADAVSAMFTALMIASVAATPFVVRDLITHSADRARATRCDDRPHEVSACQQISRRTLLIMGVAGCLAGG